MNVFIHNNDFSVPKQCLQHGGVFRNKVGMYRSSWSKYVCSICWSCHALFTLGYNQTFYRLWWWNLIVLHSVSIIGYRKFESMNIGMRMMACSLIFMLMREPIFKMNLMFKMVLGQLANVTNVNMSYIYCYRIQCIILCIDTIPQNLISCF
jgi:hypothetical protein